MKFMCHHCGREFNEIGALAAHHSHTAMPPGPWQRAYIRVKEELRCLGLAAVLGILFIVIISIIEIVRGLS